MPLALTSWRSDSTVSKATSMAWQCPSMCRIFPGVWNFRGLAAVPAALRMNWPNPAARRAKPFPNDMPLALTSWQGGSTVLEATSQARRIHLLCRIFPGAWNFGRITAVPAVFRMNRPNSAGAPGEGVSQRHVFGVFSLAGRFHRFRSNFEGVATPVRCAGSSQARGIFGALPPFPQCFE